MFKKKYSFELKEQNQSKPSMSILFRFVLKQGTKIERSKESQVPNRYINQQLRLVPGFGSGAHVNHTVQNLKWSEMTKLAVRNENWSKSGRDGDYRFGSVNRHLR